MSEITNYLSPESFNDFIRAVPKVAFKTHSRNLMTAYEYQMLYKITYYCALRISETLNLEKEDLLLDRKICLIRNAKTGKGKIQKTTIAPPLINQLADFVKNRTGKLFHTTRQTVWKYAKAAGKIAGLNIGEEQKVKSIDGIWTHLFRKSYSKFMAQNGASREIRQCKLRHSFRDSQDTYDAVDINTVKAWEKRYFEL